MTFYERVKGLCDEKGISVTSLVVDLGLSKSAVTAWKSTTHLPRAGTMKKVAEYFGLSVQELRENVETPAELDKIDTANFNQTVWQHLLELNGYDERKAKSSYLSYERATMHDALLEMGRQSQSINNNHGVIGDTHAPVTITNNAEPLTEQEQALLHIFKSLDVINKAKLLVFAENLNTEK